MNDFFNIRDIPHTVFPDIGRALNQSDIGKRVVRAYPLNGDFSFFARIHEEDQAPILKQLDKEKIILLDSSSLTITLSSEWLDQNWLTADEFVKKAQVFEPKVVYTHDSDPF